MLPSPELCRIALDLAQEAHDQEEIPVGTVLYRPAVPLNGGPACEILATARNRIVAGQDATLHAELQAISAACERVGSERLPGCFLVTTLEPCMMCTGALVLARIEAVFFFTPVLTGVGLTELLRHSRAERRFNHYPRAQLLDEYQDESADLLRSFFQKKRELHRARKLDAPEFLST